MELKYQPLKKPGIEFMKDSKNAAVKNVYEDFMKDYGELLAADKISRSDWDNFCTQQTDYAARKMEVIGKSGYKERLDAWLKCCDPLPENPAGWIGIALFLAGFHYDNSKDIISTNMWNFQRGGGFTDWYDDALWLLCFDLDREIFNFEHSGCEWRIELWKGQYCIESGAEIGLYRRKKNEKLTTDEINWNHGQKFYPCVSDDKLLRLTYELVWKDGTKLTRGEEYNWWLTGFQWGKYEIPENMTMNLSIKFDDKEMMDKFVKSLEIPNEITKERYETDIYNKATQEQRNILDASYKLNEEQKYWYIFEKRDDVEDRNKIAAILKSVDYKWLYEYSVIKQTNTVFLVFDKPKYPVPATKDLAVHLVRYLNIVFVAAYRGFMAAIGATPNKNDPYEIIQRVINGHIKLDEGLKAVLEFIVQYLINKLLLR